MANEWEERTLADLVDIKHGFAFEGRYFRDEPPGEILVTPGNFSIGGGFQPGKVRYYNGPIPEGFILAPGDLIVTMTDLSRRSDTLGFPALVPEAVLGRRFLHNQRIGKVVLKNDRTVDRRFLFYRMCAPDYRNEILASATGTTVKHTSPGRIGRFRCELPPLEEQRAIAHVLGALDDKISLNATQIDLLDTLMSEVFRSWFVDSRADAKDKVVRLGDLLAFRKGRRPIDMEATPSEGLVPVILMDAFGGREVGFAHPEGMLTAVPEDVLMVMDGASSGRVEAGYAGIVGSTLAKVEPTSGVGSAFLYYLLKHLEPQTRRHQTGTSIPHTDRNWIVRQECRIPADGTVLSMFETLAGNARRKITAARQESTNLASLRDLLLPRLVSGDLRVTPGHDFEAA